MPRQPTIEFKDTQSGQTYNMPWADKSRRPSPKELETYVAQQEKRGGLSKAWEWANTPFEREGKTLGDIVGYDKATPLYDYAKEKLVPKEKSVMYDSPELGYGDYIKGHIARMGGNLASGAGMLGDAVGNPLGMITAGAGALGRGIIGAGARTLGSLVQRAPQAAGVGQVIHGGSELYEKGDLSKPSTLAGPAAEIAFGAFGARYGGPKVQNPGAPAVGSVTTPSASTGPTPNIPGLGRPTPPTSGARIPGLGTPNPPRAWTPPPTTPQGPPPNIPGIGRPTPPPVGPPNIPNMPPGLGRPAPPKPSAYRHPPMGPGNIMEGEIAGFSPIQGEVVDDAIPSITQRGLPAQPGRLGLPPAGQTGLPPSRFSGGTPPPEPQGPFFGNRFGTSDKLEDLQGLRGEPPPSQTYAGGGSKVETAAEAAERARKARLFKPVSAEEKAAKAAKEAEDARWNRVVKELGLEPDTPAPTKTSTPTKKGGVANEPTPFVEEAPKSPSVESKPAPTGQTYFTAQGREKPFIERRPNASKPLMEQADEALAATRARQGESGFVDINMLVPEPLGKLAAGAGRVARELPGHVRAARAKFIQNLDDAQLNDPLMDKLRNGARNVLGWNGPKNLSPASFVTGGFKEIENIGPQGKKIRRLLERARLDEEANIANYKIKHGGLPQTKEGEFIYRPGSIIREKHGEEIKQFLNTIDDPKEKENIKGIIDKWLGSTKREPHTSDPLVNALKDFQGATKLSQFGLSNLVAWPMNLAQANWKQTGKATAEATRDLVKAFMSKGEGVAGRGLFETTPSYKRAETSGSMLNSVREGLEKELGGGEGGSAVANFVNKYYKVGGAEKFMRTISTNAGRGTAEDIFAQLKANPANKLARKRLDNILLEDVDEVLKQKSLTEAQLNRAGARMSEITQGRAESIDLPSAWTGNNAADLITQFKRYSFVQTRNMKNAFDTDPIRFLTTLAVAFPVAGEVVGDIKSTIKALGASAKKWVDGKPVDIPQEVKDKFFDRGKEYGGGPVGRLAENLAQSWALGLYGSMWEASQRGEGGALSEMAGPTAGDISKGLHGLQEAREGKPYPLERQAARAIPIIGTGVASEIKGSYRGSQGQRKREVRPTRRRR